MVAKKKTKKEVSTTKVEVKPDFAEKINKIANYRNKTLVYFGLMVIFFILDAIINNLIASLMFEVVYITAAILTLIYSIKLTNLKDYKFGVPFIVLSGLVLFFIVIMFIAGLIIGVMYAMQQQAPIFI